MKKYISEDDENALGNYILSLGKKDRVSAKNIVDGLKKYFFNKNNYFWTRYASAYVLLIDLKIDDEDLINYTKKIILDINGDFDLINTCLTGIGVIYSKTKNEEILDFLKQFLLNTTFDISHRCSAILVYLEVRGEEYINIYNKSKINFSADRNQSFFDKVISTYKL